MRRHSPIGSGQIVGERERQEDAVGVAQFRRFGNTLALVLADGMGGHAGGDVAAKLATRTVLAHLKAGAAAPAQKLGAALRAANDGIRRTVQANAALDGMGCTLLAVTIAGGRLRWISVGDSVLFLLRNGQLHRLNADHSMRSVFADMVARGQLDEADAARDPTRNALRSALTGEAIEMIDAPDKDLLLRDGDLILLASDGVETLSDEEIVQVATPAMGRGGQQVVDALLRKVAARNLKNQDNASAIAYLHAAGPQVHAPAGSREIGPRVLLAIAVMVVLLIGGWFAWRAFTYRPPVELKRLQQTHGPGSKQQHRPGSPATHSGERPGTVGPGTQAPAPIEAPPAASPVAPGGSDAAPNGGASPPPDAHPVQPPPIPMAKPGGHTEHSDSSEPTRDGDGHATPHH